MTALGVAPVRGRSKAEKLEETLATRYIAAMTDDVPQRVAVLEQIAATTAAALADIRTDLREIRTRQETDFRTLVERGDRHFQVLLSRGDRQFYSLLGIYLTGTAAILGLLAHSFKWI
jgi:hypothetical protein